MSGGVMLCQMKAGKMTTKKMSLSLSSPVQKVLTEAASFSGAPEERIELTYQGRILSKKDKLDIYPVADGGLIMVMEIPPQKIPEVKSVKLTPEEIRKFIVSFKTALKSSAFPKVVQSLLEKENLDNLSAACPGLSEDSLAQAILTKPDLLKHLCDPEVMEKVAEAHPCLLEAANNLAAAVHEEKQSTARSSTEASAGGGSYYLDEMSDDEMDTEDGGQHRAQRSRSIGRGGITPAQLAQALAMASGIGGGTGGGNPFQGVTGMGVSGGGQEAGAQPQSEPSSASARITANMFQQAMQQALLSSSGGQGQPQHQDTAASGGQQGGEDDLAAKVERMREMGIIDEGLAIQALQIMGGDLQAAVDLIFSGWAGGDEAMS